MRRQPIHVDPSGDDSEPDSDNDDEFEEEKERGPVGELFARLVRHPLYWTIGLAIGMLLMFFVHGAVTTIYLEVLILVPVFVLLSKEQLQKFGQKHARWAIPAALLAPFVLPLFGAITWRFLWTDWNEVLDPPKVYYLFNNNTNPSNTALQARLNRWNPGHEPDGGADSGNIVEGYVLASARAVKIEANKMSPFDSAEIDEGEPFTLIIFETVNAEMEVPQEPDAEAAKSGEESGEAAPPMTKVVTMTRLRVHFFIPLDTQKADEGQADAGPAIAKKKARFKYVTAMAPANLDLEFSFFTDAFVKATGREVEQDFINEIIRKQEAARMEGPG